MGNTFAQRVSHVKVQHQPAGIDFYSLDWDTAPHAEVVVEHGTHSFTIHHVIGLQAQQDLEDLEGEGLHEWTVYAKLSDAKNIGHDEARLAMYALLRQIREQGWQPIVEPGEPRLTGKDRLDYALRSGKYAGLDAAYVPTLDEWMQIESRTPWSFQAEGLFLEASFERDPTLTSLDKPGAYLVTLNLKSQAEYFRGFVDSGERSRWKAALPKVFEAAAVVRARKEADLRSRGIAVDETYIDPAPPL